MLGTFIISLREGVEAGLIVGIVAAFLSQSGRRDQLKWMWLGVVLAASLCLAGGIALHVLSRVLPQRQQEGLEAVVGFVAVGFITYMIVWMRRHSRNLRGSIERSAASSLAKGSAIGLVAMAFLAVLREGLETAVFLVAAFQNSVDPAATGSGAVLGLLAAGVVSMGIYGGGLHLNLGKFFRITSLALVIVAAGLVSSSIHSAHEAGWINSFQQTAVDLDWLVRPGTVTSSLVTGMFGIQPTPTVAEVAGWLAYFIPVAFFLVWSPPMSLIRRAERQTAAS